MPTYEYQCMRCGKRLEIVQPITSPPKRHCPKCNGKLERLIVSGAGLLFKGSGFHATDYRSQSYKEGAKKEAGTTTKPKTETKPVATPSGGKSE